MRWNFYESVLFDGVLRLFNEEEHEVVFMLNRKTMKIKRGTGRVMRVL